MLSLATKMLHQFAPETAHKIAMNSLRLSPTIFDAEKIGSAYNLLGMRFPNRIGLAAGFDKDGDYINQLAKLGFGFIEVGTITPKPQSGSPQPRLFRLPKASAIINRMGFNSKGVEHAARKLAQQGGNFSGILGCNIGCNKDTPPANVNDDYLHCLRRLYGLANYYVVNISSPNTPGLRNMQQPIQLHALLSSLVDLREKLREKHVEKTPLFIKVDPEQTEDSIEAMAEVVASTGIEGVIATNTTTRRPREVASLPYGGQPGGLSGKPLHKQSNEAIKMWRKHLPKETVIIGVGGVQSKADAADKFKAGADLLQIYTGLVYRGPQLVFDCARASKRI